MPELELFNAKHPKWDELYEVVCEISGWQVGGYECFAVSKLEDYVQSRIRSASNNVINPTAPE